MCNLPYITMLQQSHFPATMKITETILLADLEAKYLPAEKLRNMGIAGEGRRGQGPPP